MSSVAGLPVLFMYLSRRLILAFHSLDFRVCTSANFCSRVYSSDSLEVTTDTTVKSTDRTDKTDKDADI